MTKTIAITGATDGIGFETAKLLAAEGHTLLLHGRNAHKLAATAQAVSAVPGAGEIRTYRADLSVLSEVTSLAEAISADFDALDVLINNAGVFKMAQSLTLDGYDIRFIVNTISPYLLTKSLLPIMGNASRVVNLSSAAQASVEFDDFLAHRPFTDSDAYAQSKLAITMWTFALAEQLEKAGPAMIAVNPASFLGSKMVKEAYGQEGHDLSIGADILARAALSDEFADASGRYYDNDRRTFSNPHPDALISAKNTALVQAIEQFIA